MQWAPLLSEHRPAPPHLTGREQEDKCRQLPPERCELEAPHSPQHPWDREPPPLHPSPELLPELIRVSNHLKTIRSTSKDYLSQCWALKLLVNRICETYCKVQGTKDSCTFQQCTGSHPTCWIHCYIIQGLMNKIHQCSFNTWNNTAISGSSFELKDYHSDSSICKLSS